MHKHRLSSRILDALDEHVALLAEDGTIEQVNAAWRRFAQANGDPELRTTGTGINYLEVCRRAAQGGDRLAQATLDGIQAVLTGQQPSFQLEYPCHSPQVQRWFTLYALPLAPNERRVVVTHRVITTYKETAIASDEMIALLAQAALTQPIILRGRQPDGKTIWGELRSWPGTDADGPPRAIEGIAHDITEHIHAEEELRTAAAQLQVIARRLVETNERERRHIARELHDEIGQVLAGLKLILAGAAAEAPPALAATLATAQTTMNELIGRVRTLSLDLRPALLDDLGLLPALNWYLERYTPRTGVQVNLYAQGIDQRLPATVEIVAYRIIQEALTNVARHAGVPTATVRLLADATRLMVRVDDAGRGFDYAALLTAQATAGLSGMHERVQLIGGLLTIESAPGHGTQIIAELPLPAADYLYNAKSDM